MKTAMNAEPERKAESGVRDTRFLERNGLGRFVIVLFILAAVACVFLVGSLGN
jgi:hypothetical protein